MQLHGTKRAPEEFKEIRKEWKARKKAGENQRQTNDDPVRAAAGSRNSQVASSSRTRELFSCLSFQRHPYPVYASMIQ
jgi:hypothetical protein